MVMKRCGVFAAFLGLLCVLSDAKPYHKDAHVKAKVFREDLEVPPVPYDGGLQGAHWMSWDPAKTSHSSKNILNVQEDLAEKPKIEVKEKEDKEERQEEEELPTPQRPTMQDPCKTIYCHFGRVCQVTSEGKGECVCAGEDYCNGHSKQVCGSDGVQYPSHCELHRMACVKKLHIGIDHTGRTCKTLQEAHKRVEHVVPPKEEIDVEPLEEDKEDKPSKKADMGRRLPYDIPMEDTLPPCTDLEYERLKGNLVQYHCARIGEDDCKEDSPRKQFVANIMFNYYDRNDNQLLDEMELNDIEHRDHLEKLSQFCGLADMLTFDDLDEDANISISEFYKAFRVPTVVLDESLKVFTTTVSAGTSIELKCDIQGAVEIQWKRNGANLDEGTTNEIKTFDDGSLYIPNLGLHHMGNYTCRDKYSDHVVQTHVLKVQMSPRVRINPSTQFHTSGSSVVLKCHADGVPEPEISWEMNETPLPEDPKHAHYVRRHNNATLEIRQAVYTKDTGAYKCKARNAAGTGQDIATVFIENSKVPKYSLDAELYEVFVVFHDKGYTVYEPTHCHLRHQVSGSFSGFKIVPEYGDTISTLCEKGQPCSWGAAVNVQNKYIYITQPKLNRVVVIEIQDRSNPLEIIPTDKIPVSIEYISHLDQVWVVCWNDHLSASAKTAIVIRQASQEMHHHTVHTQPVANRFDLIKGLFLPPNNDLKHKFMYGYVVHNEQKGLYKLDLQAMKYTKNIDLSRYSCVPKSVAFIPLGGQVLVRCSSPVGQPDRSAHLVMDYVTDAVLHYRDLAGEPYVSPDGRYMVLIDDTSDTITVHKVNDDGKLEKLYDEYTNLHISDITFFPAERGRSYDFYASSSNKNDVLYMNLASGKVEMIEGVGQALDSKEWPWSKHNRVIVNGGVFGEYLMTPSRDSVVVIDGRQRHVQCEWPEIEHGNVIVWVEPLHL